MNHLIRKTTLLAVAALLVAGAANAGAPSSANSTVPRGINIVESNSGGFGAQAVDPAGVFTYTIRDAVPNPIPNAQVTIDFSACGPGGVSYVDLCTAGRQTTPPATVVVCGTAGTGAGSSVTETTNGAGVATFAIMGRQRQPRATAPFPGTPGNDFYAGCGKVTVTVPGFPSATYPNVIVAVYDADAGGGVLGGDVAACGGDNIASATYNERSDYERLGSGSTGWITGGDVAVLGGDNVSGNSAVPCSAGFCP